MQKVKTTDLTKCPMCKGKTVVNSIFGSICTNEDCFHEPKPMTAKTMAKGKARIADLKAKANKKQPLVFKRGVTTIRIPLLPAITVNNVRTIDGVNVADIIHGALKQFKPRKNVGIELVFRTGTQGTSMEVVVSKK